MHLEAEIEWTHWCTWRSLSSELRDALGGCDRANLVAVIEEVWSYTWRPWSNEFGDSFGGRDWGSLEKHLEAVVEWDWTSTWRRSMDGEPGAETLSISYVTRNRGNVTRWLYFSALIESWLMAVDRVGRHAGSWSDIQGLTLNHDNEGKTNNLGWMLYSVSNHDHAMER